MKPFDARGAFRTPTEADGLRRLAIQGFGVSVLGQGLGFASQMIATVILARLLMPSDFGLLAMVTTFSMFLVTFLQIGFPEAVVQQENFDRWMASNLCWTVAGIGFLLMIGFAAAGPLLAKTFGEPRLTLVALGVAPAIFLTSTSVIHLALLKRALRFTSVSAVDIASRLISLIVSIALAWMGWGYWALVAAVVVQPLALSIGAWMLCPWLPALPRRVAGTASIVRFALGVNGRGNLGYVTTNLDNVLVGWRFGPTALGFYKKAYDLFVLPSNQFLSVYSVAVSALSRLNRNPAQYKRYFLSGLSVLAFAGMGVGVNLTLVSHDLVRVLLGPKWEAVGRIFSWFGPGIGILLIYRTHGIIQLSLGNTRRYLTWGIIELAVTATFFLLALPLGPAGVAAAWSLSSLVLMFPSFWYAGKPIGFGAPEVLVTIWKYVLASLVAGGAVFAVTRELPSWITAPGVIGALYRIFVTSFLFLALYLGSVVILHGGYEPLYRLARVFRDMLPGRRALRPSETDDARHSAGATAAPGPAVGDAAAGV